MSWRITEFEPTPNPNAMKCWLDRPISDRPRSFLNAEAAAGDPIAAALFHRTGATNVLFNGQWMSVSKRPEDEWSDVKKRIRAVMAESEGVESQAACDDT